MAYSPLSTVQSMHSPHSPQPQTQQSHRARSTKQRFLAELSQCLFDFVIQLLPTAEEMAVKEDVRKLLERLIRTIEPNSRLLSFGSTANGFSLRNSDMDLCCLIDSGERLSASDLVTMLGDLLERETKFHVKPLPHARIPIVKLSLDPSPGLPLGIACDIGFENRLALENTRLLMCYALIDPTRVRTMVLFLKVWSKRRKINSPYKGTLSSYGFVLLVIYFLVHVKNPPVLPNLQQMPPLRPISEEDTHLNGHNIWFFDDVELLRTRWRSENTESVAELLTDFFRYYSRDFLYNTGVASIRAGLLKKESKGWQNDLSGARYHDSRERNRFCIEDPFEIDYNVARCVTKDGLYTIRGEFMRAGRVLAGRPDRAIIALAQLCEERKEEDLISAPGPRLSSLPPQTPYTVGSHSKDAPKSDRLSPPQQFFEPGPHAATIREPPLRELPEHMAPRRGRWTSPPPPEAPSSELSLFENSLGIGLELATASTSARERESTYHSSSSASEGLTDEEAFDNHESDDVCSVQSFTEGSSNTHGAGPSRKSWYPSPIVTQQDTEDPAIETVSSQEVPPIIKGRFTRNHDRRPDTGVNGTLREANMTRADYYRRSWSGPPRSSRIPLWMLGAPAIFNPHLSCIDSFNTISINRSPSSTSTTDAGTNVYYQTASPTTARSPRPNALYSPNGTHFSLLSQYQQHGRQPPRYHLDLSSSSSSRNILSPRLDLGTPTGEDTSGPETPTPYSRSHSHSNSISTITPNSLRSSASYQSTASSGHNSPTLENTQSHHLPPSPHSSSSISGSIPIQSSLPGPDLDSSDRHRHHLLQHHDIHPHRRSPISPPVTIDLTDRARQFINSPKTDHNNHDTHYHGLVSPPASLSDGSDSPTPSSISYSTSLSPSPSPEFSPPQRISPPPLVFGTFSTEKSGNGNISAENGNVVTPSPSHFDAPTTVGMLQPASSQSSSPSSPKFTFTQPLLLISPDLQAKATSPKSPTFPPAYTKTSPKFGSKSSDSKATKSTPPKLVSSAAALQGTISPISPTFSLPQTQQQQEGKILTSMASSTSPKLPSQAVRTVLPALSLASSSNLPSASSPPSSTFTGFPSPPQCYFGEVSLESIQDTSDISTPKTDTPISPRSPSSPCPFPSSQKNDQHIPNGKLQLHQQVR